METSKRLSHDDLKLPTIELIVNRWFELGSIILFSAIDSCTLFHRRETRMQVIIGRRWHLLELRKTLAKRILSAT
jgi:hypothetical protein